MGYLEFGQRIVIRDCTDKTHDKFGVISFNKHLINGHTYTCKSNLCNSAPNSIRSFLDLIKLSVFVCIVLIICEMHNKI